jgi:hypothetical protein
LRESVGDFIYQTIERLTCSDDAPKIVGMILDSPDVNDIFIRIENFNVLVDTLNEAVVLLDEEDEDDPTHIK